MNRIAITSDCTCDLSEKILEKYEIELIYFYMYIDQGCFKDTYEITAENVLEYLNNGGEKMLTFSPKEDEIADFYEHVLERCDEIIHISISSKLSESYRYATSAAERFDGKVHVIDSRQISAGMGHLIIKAAELVKEKKSAKEIVEALEQMKPKIMTTFIMDNLDCFCRIGSVSKITKEICRMLKIHPVIVSKNGGMKLKSIQIGDYEKSVMRYVKKTLHNPSSINKKRIFITHPNCKIRLISKVKQQVIESCNFENVYVTKTSATVTGNCGMDTVGILYVSE